MAIDFLLRLLCALSLLSAWSIGLAADSLETIEKRGKIKIGVKEDYPPWGMRDEAGALIGTEIDLAKDVARRLGVEFEPVVVVTSDRMQYLEEGKIDLILATMSDTPARRKVVGIVEPGYYASGINALAKKDTGLRFWDDLQGQVTCTIQGAWYNTMLVRKYGADLQFHTSVSEAADALRGGQCLAWVYDDSLLMSLLHDTDTWSDYALTFRSSNEVPWVMAVPLGEEHERFGQAISAIAESWHQSGYLIELERKWKLPGSRWLAEQREIRGHAE